MTQAIQEYIDKLEKDGLIDPNCNTCLNYFYPLIMAGRNLYNIFAPRHKPSDRCESGKHPHCSCDTCF